MLGIFEGKKGENNRLILESLLLGPKTTKQIAEYVYNHRKGEAKPGDHAGNETKAIMSIISRKGSRLEELRHKHYIEQDNALWELTIKGFHVALTLFDNVGQFWPQVKSDQLSALMKAIHEIPIVDALISDKRLKKIESYGTSSKFIERLRDCTRELIAQGVDIDSMSEEQFRLLILSKIAYALGMEFLNINILDVFGNIQNEGVKP